MQENEAGRLVAPVPRSPFPIKAALPLHSAAECSTDSKMTPTNNLSPLLAAVFLLLTIVVVEPEECCKEKRVGSTSYTLLTHIHQPHLHGELPDKCLNNCIYTVTGASGPTFCFGKGFANFLQMLQGLHIISFSICTFKEQKENAISYSIYRAPSNQVLVGQTRYFLNGKQTLRDTNYP